LSLRPDAQLPFAPEAPRRDGREVERVFDKLLDDITSGVLLPGAKVNEPEIARAMGVSRGPLREAIRRLEERQLVQCIPNYGARVVDHKPREVLDALLIRESLEGLAARLAAQNMTASELRELRAEYELGISPQRPKGHHSEFHRRIVRGAHNARLERLLNNDFFQLFKLWRMTLAWLRYGGEESWDEHERILDAIEHRDADVAELLMRRHIRRLREQSEARLLAHTGTDSVEAATAYLARN
jgi:DNA-binding GntR family transcriptional regulator